MDEYGLRDVICEQCNGEGFYMYCPDDICRATGDCRHDYYEFCRECNGEGYITIDRNNNRVEWDGL